MRVLGLTFIAILVVSVALAGEPIDPKYKIMLQSVIQKYHKEAKVMEEDNGLIYRYHTQIFKIHTISKSGDISEKSHDEEGPNVDGILVKVSLNKDEYRGQAVVPQAIRRPYWTTFIDTYPITAGQYFWVSISYGMKTDRNLINEITTCFGQIASVNDARVKEQIAVLRRLIIPSNGTDKAEVDSIYGVSKEIEEPLPKGMPRYYPVNIYQLLPPEGAQEFRVYLYVSYRNGEVWDAGLNHICVWKGRPVYARGSPEDQAKKLALEAENRKVLLDLKKIEKKFAEKLKNASWNELSTK